MKKIKVITVVLLLFSAVILSFIPTTIAVQRYAGGFEAGWWDDWTNNTAGGGTINWEHTIIYAGAGSLNITSLVNTDKANINNATAMPINESAYTFNFTFYRMTVTGENAICIIQNIATTQKIWLYLNTTGYINAQVNDGGGNSDYGSAWGTAKPIPMHEWVNISIVNNGTHYLVYNNTDLQLKVYHDGSGEENLGSIIIGDTSTSKYGNYYIDALEIRNDPIFPPGPEGEAPFHCEPTSHEYGSWEFAEYVTGGTLDEAWWYNFGNDTYWSIENRSASWAGNFTWSHNNSVGVAGFNATMLNASGMNRSGLVMNIHYNTSYLNYTMGPIYGNLSDKFYYFGAGTAFNMTSLYVWFYWNGSAWHDMWHVIQGDWSVIDIYDASNETITNWLYHSTPGTSEVMGEPYEYEWEIAPFFDNGSWIKAIYSALCDKIQFKAWGNPGMEGLFQEPAGWIIDHNLSPDVLNSDLVCHGIGVWNPDGTPVRGDFDIMNYFQENYSLNIGEAGPPHPLGKPYMEFPARNASIYVDNITAFLNATMGGDFLTESAMQYLINITNSTVKNSRPYSPVDKIVPSSDWEQNDTIRYHSVVLTDCIDAFGDIYDNYLWIYIHDTTNGWGGGATHDAEYMVLINVDGDTTWDDNDRAYFVDTWGTKWEWHGADWQPLPDPGVGLNAWFSNQNSFQNIYRYWNHSHASFFIPTAHLIKDNGVMINDGDIFNISIFSYSLYDENICFWENYNESKCTADFSEDHDTAKEREINTTGLEEWGNLSIEGDNIKYWGVGSINGVLADEYAYNMTVEKSVNRTTVSEPHEFVNLNYSIWINNTGTGNLTDVYINDTWHACGCSDYNWTFVSSNWTMENFTWYNATCTWLIHNAWIEPITPGQHIHFWFNVNVTNCTDTNLTGTMYNNCTVNATGADDQTSSTSTTFNAHTSIIIQIGPNLKIGEGVIPILGIILILGSIFLIIGMLYTRGYF